MSQQQAMDHLLNMNEWLNANLADSEFAATAERKSGIQRAHLAAASALVVLASLCTGFAAGFFTSLVGFLYPVFMTFKAIESPTKDDDTQWCMYWVCFGVLQFVEGLSDYILFWFWPYHFAKIGLIVYLAHPSLRGAEVVYNSFIGPYMKQYSDNYTKSESVNAVVDEVKKSI